MIKFGIDTAGPQLLELRNEAESLIYQLGNAAAVLTKEAGDSLLSYGLAGRLYRSKTGWILLDVPNALIRGCFDALHEIGAELPFNDEGRLNAHISVFSADDMKKIGKDTIDEVGHTFRYTLGQVREVRPNGWGENSKCWFIEIQSPELEKLRKSYGLSAKPKDGDFEFHATFGVRKAKVTQPGQVTKKTASEQAIALLTESSYAG
jgi:hypothetical protein